MTLHQGGMDRPLERLDPSESAAAQAALDDRIANKLQQPGTEAAMRRTIDAALNGHDQLRGHGAAARRCHPPTGGRILATMKQVGTGPVVHLQGC